MFEKIKKFYDMGLYTAEQVYKFVSKNVITPMEYNKLCNNEKTNHVNSQVDY